MKNIKLLFLGLSGIMAVVPGIAALRNGIGIPPDSPTDLFGGVSIALGTLCFLILILNKSVIASWSYRRVTILTAVSAIMFFFITIIYLVLFGLFVCSGAWNDSVLFPFWPEGELVNELLRYGGSRSELYENMAPRHLLPLILRSSNFQYTWTKVIFLILYQLIFATLIFAFGLSAMKKETETR